MFREERNWLLTGSRFGNWEVIEQRHERMGWERCLDLRVLYLKKEEQPRDR